MSSKSQRHPNSTTVRAALRTTARARVLTWLKIGNPERGAGIIVRLASDSRSSRSATAPTRKEPTRP